MKKTKTILITILLLALVACTPNGGPAGTGDDVEPTATLPDPQVHITPAPDVDSLIESFMGAWQAEEYALMYSLLTAESQRTINEEDFTSRYLDAAVAMTLQFETGIDYAVVGKLTSPTTATADLEVNYNTYLFGTLTRSIELPMILEAGNWHVSWNEGVIMPDLLGGNILEAVREVPSRGNIYASNGFTLAGQEDAVAIGFIPANLNTDRMSLFYTTMADLTIYYIDQIREMYEDAQPNDYVPLGEVPQEDVDAKMSALSALSGVYLNYYSSRFYYDGGIAPQAVGHLTYISQEELSRYLRLGYAPNGRYGSTGLEYSFEDELSGERGGSLYLKDSEGQILTKLAEKDALAAQSITTTLDSRLQFLLQQSLGDYRGAIVVMEVDTGRILAMVSNPQFDPNLFDINNQNFMYAPNPYVQTDDPVFNRATSGQYPLGSVFKIVTMAAALDNGIFDENSEIYCGHSIEVCGNELFDWTYEKERPPSGDLTLPEGLMRSCNPWFYYIGEQLVFAGSPNAIAEMARAFGMGSVTGVEIPEQPGNIPAQTATCELSTQLAIGQGEMTVTPLQVAQALAAIANGGTLYRPALVEQIGIENSTPSYEFEPEAVGSLPISEDHLAIIQGAMLEVVRNGRGTAHLQLGSLRYRVYGKTGTAQNPFGISHAWFAGYTDMNNEDLPDIAVVVLLENAGEGSEMAAPVFRRAVSLYFSSYSDYGVRLPWEAYPYVVASETPIPSDTPIPTNTPIPTDTPVAEENADENGE